MGKIISMFTIVSILLILRFEIASANNDNFEVIEQYAYHYIRSYKPFKNLLLYSFKVPDDTLIASFEFRSQGQKDIFYRACTEEKVFIYVKYGSYPIFNLNNMTLPKNFVMDQKSLYQVNIDGNHYSTKNLHVISPKAGYWFVGASIYQTDETTIYLSNIDTNWYCETLLSASLAVKTVPVMTISNYINLNYSLEKNPGHELQQKIFYYKYFITNTIQVTQITMNFSQICQSCNLTISTNINQIPNAENHLQKFHLNSKNASSRAITMEWDKIKNIWVYISLNISFNSSKDDYVSLNIQKQSEYFENANYKLQYNNQTYTITRYLLTRYFTKSMFNIKFLSNDTNSLFNFTINRKNAIHLIEFELREFEDIFGVLLINITTDNKTTNKSFEIYGCLNNGIANLPISNTLCTNKIDNTSYATNVLLRNSSANFSEVLYPSSGLWNLGIGYSGSLEEINVTVTIMLTNCLKNCENKGYCAIYTSVGLRYSNCQCYLGHKGLDCSIKCNKHEELPCSPIKETSKLTTALLAFSNLFFIPSIGIAILYNYQTEALCYFFTMLSSFFYHTCEDTGFQQSLYKCPFPLFVLQTCDFYCGLLSMWLTIIAVTKIKNEPKSLLHTLGSIFLAFGVSYNKHATWVYLVPLLVGILLIFIHSIYYYFKYRALLYPKRYLKYSLTIGILLDLIGFLCFTLLKTKSNYYYVHSLWHLFMALSIPFLLPK